MAKSIKQIADELGVSKQKVYRYVKKNNINEVHHDALQNRSVKQYDEAAEMLIKKRFVQETASREVLHDALQKHINDTAFDVVLNMLKKELEIKNQQIIDLNERLSESNSALVAAQQMAQAAQALHAGTIQHQLTDVACDSDQSIIFEKKGFFKRWVRK